MRHIGVVHRIHIGVVHRSHHIGVLHRSSHIVFFLNRSGSVMTILRILSSISMMLWSVMR